MHSFPLIDREHKEKLPSEGNIYFTPTCCMTLDNGILTLDYCLIDVNMLTCLFGFILEVYVPLFFFFFLINILDAFV